MARGTPPPFMANAIKNFHIFWALPFIVAALINLPNFGNKSSVSIFRILPIRLYAAIRRYEKINHLVATYKRQIVC